MSKKIYGNMPTRENRIFKHTFMDDTCKAAGFTIN